jgi:hypothetical protein
MYSIAISGEFYPIWANLCIILLDLILVLSIGSSTETAKMLSVHSASGLTPRV